MAAGQDDVMPAPYEVRVSGGIAAFTPTYTTPTRAVLIVGRPAGDWLAAGSAQPRALVDLGCAVFVSDADTVAEIDTLAAAADDYVSLNRMWLVACGAGCGAALEWLATRDPQVGALSLQAPSGVSLGSPRQYTLRDMLGGPSPRTRAQVWHVDGDSAAVTLAGQLGATDGILDDANPTLATSAPIVAALGAADAGWTHYAAAVEKRRWVSHVETVAATVGWQKTADGHQSLVIPSVGEVWHMFADTGCGTIDVATGTFTSGDFVRNSVVRCDLAGSFVGQVWNGSFTGPSAVEAWIPNQVTWPGQFWWPIGGATLDTLGRPVVLAIRLSGVATGEGADVITVDPSTGAVISATSIDTTSGWSPVDLATHADHHYVYFTKDTANSAGVAVSRVHRADLGDPTRWERWTDVGWTTMLTEPHIPMSTTAGQPLPSFLLTWSMRSSRYGFLAVGKTTFDARLHLYRSGWPQGPWEPAGVVDVDIDLDGPRFGDDQTWSYIPAWHPHLDTAGDLLVSYASGYADPPAAPGDFWYGQTQFAAIPRTLLT